MTAQTLAENMDSESGNLIEITLSDRKTVAHATEFPSRITRNVVTVPVSYFHDKQMHLCDLSSGGTRCSSVVRAFAHGAMGRRIDPSWWTH